MVVILGLIGPRPFWEYVVFVLFWASGCGTYFWRVSAVQKALAGVCFREVCAKNCEIGDRSIRVFVEVPFYLSCLLQGICVFLGEGKAYRLDIDPSVRRES